MTATTTLSRELKLAIFAGCMISFISFGFSASFSVFLRPMSIELDWGREVFSLSLAIQALMWGITQPLAGMYADKHGSSRVLAFGAVLVALGFALRGVFDDPTLFIQTGFIVGVGTGACSFPVVIVALGKVVQPAQRSFIMGLGTAAASAGMFAGAPIATTLIGLMGWGVSIFFLAFSFVLILPLLILLHVCRRHLRAVAWQTTHGVRSKSPFQIDPTPCCFSAFSSVDFTFSLFKPTCPPILSTKG